MERDDKSTPVANLSLAVEIYGDAATKPLVALLPENSTEVPILMQSPDDGKSATSNIEEPTGATTMRSKRQMWGLLQASIILLLVAWIRSTTRLS